MKTRYAVSPREYARMGTEEMLAAFLLEDLFAPGEARLTYWETDRTVVGGIVPTDRPLCLHSGPELDAAFFCQRREVGVINLGAAGQVFVDGREFFLNPLDALYVGRGAESVEFRSPSGAAQPAQFYLLSYPAHTAYPTTQVTPDEAQRVELGSPESANRRTLFRYIHEGGVRSCQLVMGCTRLATGSVWNTVPPHTHARRSEVYLYFDLPPEAAAFHFMGPGDETRHLVVRDRQAVLSPPWSIHAGCGTTAYAFVWGMGGENQRFDDMDPVPVPLLR